MSATAIRLTTDQLLYGVDDTPRIVAVEPAGAGRVVVFRRDELGHMTVTDATFRPWLIAARAEPWAALRPRPQIEQLAGDRDLRFLITFDSWQVAADAARAGREAGERLFRLGSPVEQYLMATGQTLFKDMLFDDVRRLQIDIETTGFDPQNPTTEVIAVALSTSDGVEEIFALEDSEAALFEHVSERIRQLDPDVIEGHNLFNFDVPFMVQRAARYGIGLTWGRDGSVIRLGAGRQRFKVGALTLPFTPAYIHGRHIVDTYQQIQRYDSGGHLTSYGLKNAVEALGLTRPDREFIPGDQIRDVWRSDRDRLLRYALGDVRDVDTISRLALPTEFYQTQILPRSFQAAATGGPGEKINDLMVRAYLASGESIPTARTARDYPGGHAELLEVGAFSPIVKCDVESLYPSIMLKEGITATSDTLGAYLPMLRDLTRRRLEAKVRSRQTTGAEQAMWEGLQSSFKVLINSFYGYLGYGGGLFNDFEAAEQVTLIGQRIIKQTVDALRGTGSRPIEVDTDGVYFVPPVDVATEDQERAYVDQIGSTLPIGIRLAHDGHYRAMLSLRLKTYGLLTDDGKILLKGSALRSRRMEGFLREFLRSAATGFLVDNRDEVRETYFRIAERIRRRELQVGEFSQWTMLNEETLAKQLRLKRLVDRLPPSVRTGERIEVYERQDGEIAHIDEYAMDENIVYLLRRLRDIAERFHPLFPTDSEFNAFFPSLTAKTDLASAREQQASTQLNLFE